MIRRLACTALLLMLQTGLAQADEPDRSWWVAPQLHLTAVSAIVQGDALGLSAGVGASAGHRWGPTGLLLHLETTWWGEALLAEPGGEDVFTGVAQGALALGVGVERLYADRGMRFMLSAGPTLMLRNTLIDSAGTVGIWGEIRPAGIRVSLPAKRTMVIDVLSFALLLPDLSGIPLLLLQFRTTVSVEFDGLGSR